MGDRQHYLDSLIVRDASVSLPVERLTKKGVSAAGKRGAKLDFALQVERPKREIRRLTSKVGSAHGATGKVDSSLFFSGASKYNGALRALVGWSQSEQKRVKVPRLKCNLDCGLTTKHFASLRRTSGRQARNLRVGSVPPRGWFAAE